MREQGEREKEREREREQGEREGTKKEEGAGRGREQGEREGRNGKGRKEEKRIIHPHDVLKTLLLSTQSRQRRTADIMAPTLIRATMTGA